LGRGGVCRDEPITAPEELPLPTRSPAERLDEAVDRLLSDERPSVDTELLPLVDTASRVRQALPLLPTGHGFEAKLAARLAHPNPIASAVATIGDVTLRELRHPSPLLVAGAVSSAAVGVSITALVVWRGTRRHAANR
jgi:hypothetical protein